MCTTSVWILDFECYQFLAVYYPVEIALLDVNNVVCSSYYIKYPGVNIKNATEKWQHKRHGLTWNEGDETLQNAINHIQSKVTTSNDKVHIYVKGEQKQQLVSNWFLFCHENSHVHVLDIGNRAPNFNTLKDQCVGETCTKHLTNLQHFCARRKCFQLLPYVVSLDVNLRNKEGDVTSNSNSFYSSEKQHTIH